MDRGTGSEDKTSEVWSTDPLSPEGRIQPTVATIHLLSLLSSTTTKNSLLQSIVCHNI